MTREEQIRQAALAYSFDTDGGHSGDLNAGRDDFIEGAKWADEHPLPLSEEAVKEIVIEHEAWAYEQWHCDVNEKCSFYEWYLERRKTNK